MVAADEHYLHLLLFSLEDTWFGVDLEQIDTMSAYDGEPADDMHWVHDMLGFGRRQVAYKLPTVLTIKSLRGQPFRVIIDTMKTIGEYRWQDMIPCPALLEPYLIMHGIWGILPQSDTPVLLVDFQRIADNYLIRHHVP